MRGTAGRVVLRKGGRVEEEGGREGGGDRSGRRPTGALLGAALHVTRILRVVALTSKLADSRYRRYDYGSNPAVLYLSKLERNLSFRKEKGKRKTQFHASSRYVTPSPHFF